MVEGNGTVLKMRQRVPFGESDTADDRTNRLSLRHRPQRIVTEPRDRLGLRNRYYDGEPIRNRAGLEGWGLACYRDARF
jgi:hypothetical protein